MFEPAIDSGGVLDGPDEVVGNVLYAARTFGPEESSVSS